MFWNDFFEFGVQLHINSWLGETIPEFDSFWKEGLGSDDEDDGGDDDNVDAAADDDHDEVLEGDKMLILFC